MTEKAKTVKDVLSMGMTIVDLKRQLEDLKKENKKLTDENNQLWDRDQFLCALEAHGVDNWGGWGDAMETVDQWNSEE
jgi:hypothetical protein